MRARVISGCINYHPVEAVLTRECEEVGVPSLPLLTPPASAYMINASRISSPSRRTAIESCHLPSHPASSSSPSLTLIHPTPYPGQRGDSLRACRWSGARLAVKLCVSAPQKDGGESIDGSGSTRTAEWNTQRYEDRGGQSVDTATMRDDA